MIDDITRKKEGRFKKVILHVGPDKTGSSSIQYSLNKARGLLLINGVFYPPGRPGDMHHHIFGSCFTSGSDLLVYNDDCDERQLIVARDKYYLRSIQESFLETQADTLVFSYEGFIYLTEDSLELMKKFLGKYCDSFEIVFYARAPLSYAASAMSQHVKMCQRASKGGRSLPVIKNNVILGKLCRVFGKSQINIRLFSIESLPKGNVVLDFLSLLDLPQNIQEKIATKRRNKNTSLSHEALLIGDKMAELLDGYMSSCEYNNKRGIGAVFLPAIKGRKIQLTDLQQEEILKHAAPHIEYLFKEFGITMKKEPRTVYKPLRVSEDTIDFTAKKLLRVLVPEFRQPVEDSARNERKLDRYFILRVMLAVKKFIFIFAAYRRFQSVRRRLI